MASDRVRLIDAVPTFDDLKQGLAQGRLLLCNVDLQVLKRKEKREGHLLIVEAMDDTNIIVDDPGPAGGLGIAIPIKLFYEAWTSPAKTMANVIFVWKD